MTETNDKDNKPWLFEKGQEAWNKGTGGCKRGHDPSLYVPMPGSGIYVCLGCKRENGKKYREKNRKEINLKNRVGRYGISISDYNKMIQVQDNKCAICGDELNNSNIRIDHDHKTGDVRGLLCTSCNTGLGLMKDSPEVLGNAKKYLENNGINS
jgi:DNA-directed RNA polymerase subunit RPC12/RpoP